MRFPTSTVFFHDSDPSGPLINILQYNLFEFGSDCIEILHLF